jgi:hypothetical protein
VDASGERLVVLDYKDSRAKGEWTKKLDPTTFGETNFQLPAYLLAAARALPGRSRLAASYLLLRSAERLAPYEAEPDEPVLALERGALEAARASGLRTFADGVLAAVGRIREGQLPAVSRDCTGCAFGAVCRSRVLVEGQR